MTAAPMISSGQLLITGGSFVQVNQAKSAFEKLQDASSPAAFHNSAARFDPPKCHENTRVAVLHKIMQWIIGSENREALITWLFGPAGTGKSAIAQSIAELCDTERLPLASFFFSRTDPTRNHANSLFPTLAYQIATTISETRDHIESVIQQDPLIFSRSIEVQLESLVLGPLRRVSNSAEDRIPALIIFDGLDECGDSAVQCRILQIISDALKRLGPGLPLKFLIASRPEQDISIAFNHGHLNTAAVTRLALDDSYRPSADIELYLRDKFKEIKRTHPSRGHIPSSWPSDDSIEHLVRKSSGQFIYASTVVKYVKSTRHKPPARLEIIIGIRPVPSSRDIPFAELDALYTHILSAVDDIELVYDILTLSIMTQKMGLVSGPVQEFPVADMEKFLALEAGDIPLLLGDLRSIVTCSDKYISWGFKSTLIISFLHASFPDFLLDPTRSQQLYINPGRRSTRLLWHCLHHMSRADYQDRYGAQYIKYFCSTADPSPELHQKILSFSLPDYSGHRPSPDELEYFNHSISDLLSGFKHMEFSAIALKQLDSHFQSQVDQFWKNILENFIHKKLRFLTIFSLVGIQHGIEATVTGMKPQQALVSFYKTRPIYKANVGQFLDNGGGLAGFLEDPLRSREYAPDGQKYAIAALLCLKCLCHTQSFFGHERALWSALTHLPFLLEKSAKDDNLREYAKRFIALPKQEISNFFSGSAESYEQSYETFSKNEPQGNTSEYTLKRANEAIRHYIRANAVAMPNARGCALILTDSP